MTEKAHEIKAPNPTVVEKATEKVEAGDDLNQREQAALAAQAAVDAQRGYRAVEWKGQQGYQSLITGHTAFGAGAEYEMNAHHAALHQANIADPRP